MNALYLKQDDVDRAHDAAQRVFQRFAAIVAERLPSVHAVFGKNSSERFPLYSYVTFEDKNMPEVDPVVAAVDLRISADRLAIKTDLIGEETGKVHLKPETQSIAMGSDAGEWIEKVTGEAERLADRALPVLLRLFGLAAPIAPGPMPNFPDLAHKS